MAEDIEGTTTLDLGLTALEAHGMLNSLSVVRATVSTIRLHWGRIEDERCIELLERAEEQLVFLSDSLSDLVRGLPSDAREFLDELRQTPT